VEALLWSAGIALIGWCLLVWVLARVAQELDSEALDAERARSAAASSAAPAAPPAPAIPAAPEASAPTAEAAPAAPRSRPAPDPLLVGRLEIARLGMSVMVREGTDDKTLRRAVGHIAGTALPGEDGNVGLAGHRDTFFRSLRGIRRGDEIRLVTADDAFLYRVFETRVVGPADTSVLASDGAPSLTLVTCWPFKYVGHAPKRFVVRARRAG